MTVSGARLGGALNPLSSHTPKQWSLASSAVPDFFPDSLPASRGALAPSGCVHTANPSPLLGSDLQSLSLSSQPHPSWWVSRQASRAGEYWSAPILRAGISPLCPLHPCVCALLRGSKAFPAASPHLCPRRGFLVCGNLSSFTAPSQRGRSCPYLFVSVFSFSFCPTQVRREFLAFWEV